MNCEQQIAVISEYLDGNLPWHRRARFWVHLRFCPDCRNYFASFYRTLTLVRMTYRNVASGQRSTITNELAQAIQAARK